MNPFKFVIGSERVVNGESSQNDNVSSICLFVPVSHVHLLFYYQLARCVNVTAFIYIAL